MEIGLDLSRRCRIQSLLDTGDSPSLLKGEVLELNWLTCIHQRSMPNIRNALDIKLRVSKTITLHLHMTESRTRINYGVVKELVVRVLLRTTYIHRLINLINQAGIKTVSHHSPSVPIVMVYEAPGEAKNKKSDIRQDSTEEVVMVVTLNEALSFDVAFKVGGEVSKNLKLAQERYKFHHDRHVGFALTLKRRR